MERHKSALKAARQATVRGQRNRMLISKVKTSVKKFRAELGGKIDNKEEAKKKLSGMLNELQRTLMKAANKGIMKKGTASRQISRLSLALTRAVGN
jgi:ribosomal protein S20